MPRNEHKVLASIQCRDMYLHASHGQDYFYRTYAESGLSRRVDKRSASTKGGTVDALRLSTLLNLRRMEDLAPSPLRGGDCGE